MSDGGDNCPLCAEEMDLTDQQLKPCKCGYEICVWCWHHLMEMAEKDGTKGRCPGCRTPYDKEKIVGTAAKCDRVVAEHNMEKKRSQKTKSKFAEGRNQLSNVRVIQRNLVYIVGLPLHLADEDLLQHREYFGQYGKVLKVSMSRTAAGVIQQFPNNTCSVYITYSKEEEAVCCIKSVHGFTLEGRPLRACFGTTKYCYAWLRNVPCTNTDCVYLHEIGPPEDSFTKDEVISAYTRNRVQQITGVVNNQQQRSGTVLPPPLDDYKHIMKSTSSNLASARGSSSSERLIGLPPAASWDARAPNPQASAITSTYSNEHLKQKVDKASGAVAFSSTIVTSSQDTLSHDDASEKKTSNESDQGISLHTNASNSVDTSAQSSGPVSERSDNADGNMLYICSDDSSVGIRNEYSGVVHHHPSLVKDALTIPENQVLQPSLFEQSKELPTLPAAEKPLLPVSELFVSSNHTKGNSQCEMLDKCPEVEEDIVAFNDQRLKDPEVGCPLSYLPSSANILNRPNHSRSQSSEHEGLVSVSFNEDPFSVNSEVTIRSSITGASENTVQSSCAAYTTSDPPLLSGHTGLEKHIVMPPGNPTNKNTDLLLDGESSIISNILSIDLDTRDESRTSPQNFAQLRGESDGDSGSLCRISSSRKVQTNNQSRLSFARQEESKSRSLDVDHLFGVFGQLSMTNAYGSNSSGIFMDKSTVANSSVTSNNVPASRASILAPPGFSVPSQAPPPGFASHERLKHSYDTAYGNRVLDASSVLRNSYHPHTKSTGNVNGLDFYDPAILQVVESGVQSVPNNSVIDVRSSYHQQFNNALENEARLKLLMQISVSQPQNLRYSDAKDSYSLVNNSYETPSGFLNQSQVNLSNSYGIPSRLDQSQLNNISPFEQPQLQQSKNSPMENGQWNEVHGGNNLSIAEHHRNERLGFNKFYPSYEDTKLSMPSPGELCNRP